MLVAAAAIGCGPPPEKPPPSILLLTIDTLRADHLPFEGYPRETAPFLAGLLDGGTRYPSAHSTSSWTVPALATLLTGVYPPTHGVVHGVTRGDRPDAQEVIPPSLTRLPSELRRLGYRTYAVVANLHAHPDFGFAEGFDRYRCVGFSTAEEVNGAVAEWRDEIAAAEQPVLLWLHYFDPHYPLHRREPWASRFRPGIDDDEVALVDELAEAWPDPTPEILADLERRLDIGRALYDSEIRHADEAVREVVESMPFLREWMVVFSADHGEEFAEHGDLGHSFNLHVETVRVPLLIRSPEASGPAEVPAPVSWVDLAPTLLRAAGGEAPDGWQGIPLVDDGGGVRSELPADRAVLATLDRFPNRRHRQALIGPQWKLITGREPGERWLYDVVRDPGETRDLAAERPWLAAKLARDLDALVAALPRAPDVELRTLTPDQRESLEALGYLEE